MVQPFKSNLVLQEKIAEATFRAYHVGFDQNKFRLQPLADLIMRVVPEFAFGLSEGFSVQMNDMVDKLREAAKLIYTTDKYAKRGEFGELILHLLLRDFCGTVPLISKIYFKDSTNVAVHGFDAVHVTEGTDATLWLGESKLYVNGSNGIKALVADIKNHLKEDYLRQEFSLIAKKIPGNFPEREKWLELIDKHQKLDTIFKRICIPVVCTYSSDIFKSHTSETAQYFADFKKECESLKKEFDMGTVSTNVDIILMLLPIPSKNELTDELHNRLRRAQSL